VSNHLIEAGGTNTVVVTNTERDPMTVIRVENTTGIIIGIATEGIMMTGGAIIKTIEQLKKITNGAVEEITTMTMTAVKTIIQILGTTSIRLEMTVISHTKEGSIL
jgi:hypothetical protein